jgi:drug/metabolite transporter (DMT)-like permease
MAETTPDHRAALGALALSLLVFAPSFAATKVAVDGLGVSTSAAIRLLGGGGILLLAAHRSWPALRPHWRTIVLLGIAGMGLQTWAISVGIDAGTASLGALILGLEPIFIAIFGALLIRERPSRWVIGGLALGLAGVVVVSGVLTVGVSGTPLVAVLALGVTTISFSGYAARLPELTRTVGGIPAAGATMTAGGLAIVPLALIEVVRGTAVQGDARTSTVVGSAYLVFGQTAVGYALFTYAVARIRTSLLAVILYALPPLAVLADWALIDERPHGRDIAGGALILLAVAVGTRRGARVAPGRAPGSAQADC